MGNTKDQKSATQKCEARTRKGALCLNDALTGYPYCRVHCWGRASNTPWYQNGLYQTFFAIIVGGLIAWRFYVIGPSAEKQDAILSGVEEIQKTASQLGKKLDDEEKNHMLVRGLAEVATDATWIGNAITNEAIKQLSVKLQRLLDKFESAFGTNYSQEIAHSIRLAKATAARARGEFDEVLVIIPDNVAVEAERSINENLKLLELRADAQSALFRFDDALKTYDAILNFQPTHIDVLLSSGGALNQLGRHAEATNRLTRLLNQVGKSAIKSVHPLVPILGFHERGNAYAQLGLPEQALSDYQNGLRLSRLVVSKGFPELAFTQAGGSNNVGMIYRKLGRSNEAITNFSVAIGALQEAVNEDKVRGLPLLLSSVLRNRGGAYLEIEKPAQAINDYNAALVILRGLTNIVNSELDSRIADTLMHRSAAYGKLGSLKEEKNDATESVRLFTLLDQNGNVQIKPDLAKAKVRKGMTYIRAGDPKLLIQVVSGATNALSVYRDLMRQGIQNLNVEVADAQHVHGLALFLLGRFDEASTEFTEAIHCYSNRVAEGDYRFERSLANMYETRGMNYFEWKNCSEAISDCTRALEVRRRSKQNGEPSDAEVSATL
jgi:tetratricopeptide (TPR) repeat protein